MVKNLLARARDIRDSGLIPGSGGSPGGGHGNPVQYSCLENPMDRGAWKALVVHGVAEWDMTGSDQARIIFTKSSFDGLLDRFQTLGHAALWDIILYFGHCISGADLFK